MNMRLEVGRDLVAIGGVAYDEDSVFTQTVNDQVIEDPTRFVAAHRVEGLADFEPANVVRDQAVRCRDRLRSTELELTHVRDVEKTCPGSHRLVLLPDSRVLHGHSPSSEGNHLGTEGAVLGGEGRFPKVLSHEPGE